jgi:hypothetical protein
MVRNWKIREIHMREKVRSDKPQTMKILLILSSISVSSRTKFEN